MNTSIRTKETAIIIVAIVLIIAGLVAWQVYFRSRTSLQKGTETPAGAPIENTDIGSQIYGQATNPVKNKLPESVAPVSNPLKDVYKNPFE